MKSTIFLSICIVVSFFLASNADPFPKFLQGDWDAFALLIEAPLAQAQALLAPGLELKPQNFTAKGKEFHYLCATDPFTLTYRPIYYTYCIGKRLSPSLFF
jgi:hypothetical protein